MSRDPCVLVMEALMSGARVNIGDCTYMYDHGKDEVFLVGKTSSGEEVLLKTDTISLNGFIKMVHKNLSEEQLMSLINQLTIRRLSHGTVNYGSQ